MVEHLKVMAALLVERANAKHFSSYRSSLGGPWTTSNERKVPEGLALPSARKGAHKVGLDLRPVY